LSVPIDRGGYICQTNVSFRIRFEEVSGPEEEVSVSCCISDNLKIDIIS